MVAKVKNLFKKIKSVLFLKRLFYIFLSSFPLLGLALYVVIIFKIYNFAIPFKASSDSIGKISDTYFIVNINSSEDKRSVSYEQVIKKPEAWASLKEISSGAISAIVASEDAKFMDHPGFDVEELEGALIESLEDPEDKKSRGASTISQQLIKNLYLTHERSFSRKVNELMYTFILEGRVSKEKILESYLNVIEYGKNIYGIKMAANYYFNKPPSDLSAREGAFLAMLLPSPVRYSQSYRQRRLTPFAKRIINSILFKMLQGGYIGQVEYLNSLKSRFSWEQYEQTKIESHDLTNI